MSREGNIDRLLRVMARLRDPDGGCPWDLEQDFASIAPYTIEEAYEVDDAIRRNDMEGLCDELGDLLLQVVFHARMAEEAGAFDFNAVAAAIADKMVARHPHVFGDAEIVSADGVRVTWEEIKARERAERRIGDERPVSALDGVAQALPALMRAEKLQKRAARVGFDWPSSAPVIEKVAEELEELRTALADGGDRDAAASEYGDLLFSLVNVGRHLGFDPETALREANAKFERRFRSVEQQAEDMDRSLEAMSLDELEALWQRAKAEAEAE